MRSSVQLQSGKHAWLNLEWRRMPLNAHEPLRSPVQELPPAHLDFSSLGTNIGLSRDRITTGNNRARLNTLDSSKERFPWR
ncbi:hypothetical protein M8818_000171 [Zalaria obscura]|uniref:Uncharacterized protein n=1 Tax=Zalaria obscura TaxID=2024903 RepID=A0ACC3SNT4_9PEZI